MSNEPTTGTMSWERFIELVSGGKIAISDNGIETLPVYELRQIATALVSGYMRNYNIAKSLRNSIKAREAAKEGRTQNEEVP